MSPEPKQPSRHKVSLRTNRIGTYAASTSPLWPPQHGGRRRRAVSGIMPIMGSLHASFTLACSCPPALTSQARDDHEGRPGPHAACAPRMGVHLPCVGTQNVRRRSLWPGACPTWSNANASRGFCMRGLWSGVGM